MREKCGETSSAIRVPQCHSGSRQRPASRWKGVRISPPSPRIGNGAFFVKVRNAKDMKRVVRESRFAKTNNSKGSGKSLFFEDMAPERHTRCDSASPKANLTHASKDTERTTGTVVWVSTQHRHLEHLMSYRVPDDRFEISIEGKTGTR